MTINYRYMISIFYISRADFFSKRTNVHNSVKTCEALAGMDNVRVTLISSFRGSEKGKIGSVLRSNHGVKRDFSVIALNSFSGFFWGNRFRVLSWLEVFLANFSLIKFLLKKRGEVDIIYLRDQHLFLAIIFTKYILRKPIYFEVHAAQRNIHTQFLLNLMVRISDGIVAISYALKDYYEKLNNNIIVAFCLAPEPENFPYHKSLRELREELSIPLNKFIMGYVGRLSLMGNHSNYNIENVVEALKFLPDNILFIVIGGTDKEMEFLKKIAENISVSEKLETRSWIPRSTVPSYLLSFDVLILPKLGERPGDSPAKMFEYLAARKPIVAAKTSPVSEVLHDRDNSILVINNDSREWAESIERLMNDKVLADKISKKSFEDSHIYSWENRGKGILDFISKSFKDN